ncbi:MAG: LamG domain-containing protein, partial [Clostridia bacterium]|nr:LamG domain-containing protein [Clostridia bacterium]
MSLSAIENGSLVYRLDFSDPDNLGKNTAGTSLPDAVFFGNVESDKRGDNSAVSLRSAGTRKNYISVPSAALDYDEVTIAGWFRIDGDLPNYSRLISVNGGSKYLEIMPSHSGHYDGWCINAGYEFPKSVRYENGWSNMPGLYGQLAVYDVWVNYAFTLTKDSFKAYQNGKLLWEEKGDFSPKRFCSEDGNIFLGATLFDATPDISADYSDFRIYSKALTGEEITDSFSITWRDMLTAEYDFENGAKDNVRGYKGSYIGNAKTASAYESPDKVLVLDGTLKNGKKTSLELNPKTFVGHHEMTLSFDLYVSSSTGAYSRIIEINGLNNGARRLTIASNWAGSFNFAVQYTNNNDKPELEQLSTFSPVYDKWVKYAFVLDGKTVRVYADGVLVHEAKCDWTDDIFYDGAHFTKAMISIGRTQYWGDDPLTGAMDDLRVYSCALTEKEILEEAGI